MGKERFGPNLRRIREQRGITLEQLADTTNVDVELWMAMERNDFSRWPSGIFARAFIREYARAIGIEAESTVDEFCRWFPHGDRRRGHIIQAEAELLGVRSGWQDDLAPAERERRRTPRPVGDAVGGARESILARRSRLAAASFDVAVVCAGGALIARAASVPVLPVMGAVTLAYHAAGVVLLGSTAGSALVAAWLRHSSSTELRRVPLLAFPRLRRNLRAAARS